jgi:O-antigen/teichoic acid export membrane protein
MHPSSERFSRAWLREQAASLSSRFRSSILLKSGSWYLVATFAQRGLSFLAIFVFAELLTPDEYGTVSIYGTWLLILGSTITLNVYTAISRAWYDYDEKQFAEFVSATLTLGLATSLIAALLFWLAPEFFVERLFKLPRYYLVLAAVTAAGNFVFDSTLAIWLVKYQYKARSITGSLFAVARIGLSLLLILLPIAFFQRDRALSRVLGMSLASAGFGLYFLPGHLRKGRKFIAPAYWRYALAYSVPLIPHVISNAVMAQFDRILVDTYIGRAEAGVYTFAYQLGESVGLVWLATNQAWIPWFYEQMDKQSYPIIRQRARQYFYGFTALTVLAIGGGTPVLRIFAPAEYQTAIAITPIVMAGMFFRLVYSFYVNVEFYEKKTAYISIGTIISAALNVGLNLLLIPRYGYVIAAWTTLITYIFLASFHAFIVRHVFKAPRLFRFWLMIGIGGGVIALGSIVSYLLTRLGG